MNCTDIDSLLHAFERHAKEEDSRYLQVHWQIDEDLAKCRDSWLIGSLSSHSALSIICQNRWRNCECTGLLKVLDSVEDVTKFRCLYCPSKNFVWLILVPEFNLKDQLLKWTTLHLRLGELRHVVLEKSL